MKENLDFIENEIAVLLETKQDHEENFRTLYGPFQGLLQLNDNYSIDLVEKPKRQILEETSYQIPDFCFIFRSNKVLVLTIFFQFLSFWICFNRALFLDLMIYNIYIAFHLMKKINKKVMKILIMGIAVSIIFDMSWIIIFSQVFIENNLMRILYLDYVVLLESYGNEFNDFSL